MKFRCDCQGHELKIEYIKDKYFPFISASIYERFGKYRILKHPKLLGDVVIVNNRSKKELTKFRKFLNTLIKRLG